jgi:hypothetical protein
VAECNFNAGRLLLLSPFNEKHNRVTAQLAAERNCFVAAISDEVLIPYATPGGKTEALSLDLLPQRVQDRPVAVLVGFVAGCHYGLHYI